LQALAEDLPGPLCLLGYVEFAVADMPQQGRRLDKPQEHHGQHVGIAACRQPVASLAVPDQIGHAGDVAADDGMDPRPPFRVPGIELVGEEHARDAVVVAHQLGVPHQESPELLKRIGILVADRRNIAVQPGLNEIKDGIEDLVLAGEVPVNSRRNKADPRRDAGDAQASQTIAADDIESHLSDLVFANFGLEFLGRHCPISR